MTATDTDDISIQNQAAERRRRSIALAYYVAAVLSATLIYAFTFREAQFFLEFNLGRLATRPNLAGFYLSSMALGGLFLSSRQMLRSRWAQAAYAAWSLGWAAVIGVGSVPLWRYAACALAAPGWAVIPAIVKQIREFRKPLGSLKEWMRLLIEISAVAILVFASASAYTLIEHPGLRVDPTDKLVFFAKSLTLAAVLIYALILPAVPGVMLAQRLGLRGSWVVGGMCVLFVQILTAILLMVIRPVDPAPLRFTNLLFALCLGVPLAAQFGASLTHARRKCLAEIWVHPVRQGWNSFGAGSKWRDCASTAIALVLLVSIHMVIGNCHMVYGWGSGIALLYSSMSFVLTVYLLMLVAPRIRRGIVAIVALLPLFSAVFVAIGPASAQSFTAYLNLDQNLGAFYKTYYSLLPSQAEHSRSLRRILDQSKRFSELVPSLSGTQTLALHAMPQRPHVIFILADGLRRMSYGDRPHDARRYPGLALLKRHSVEYSNAWTSYNATAGSMPALLAGAWHPVWYEAAEIYAHDNVLARAAAMAGYRLYCLGPYAGMDALWPAGSAVAVQGHNDSVKDPHMALPEALRILEEHEKSHPGQPAFLYVHLFATHQPLIYRPEAPFDHDGRHWMLALYENNVAYVDAHLRLFIEALEKRGKLHESLFLVAADHGEEFFEYGRVFHGWEINPAVMRVPLYVHYPAGIAPQEQGAVSDLFVNLIDVAPTLTEVMGVPISRTSEVQGISLLAQHRDPPQGRYFPLFSWMSPLIGEVRSRPLSMRVLDAQTGKESQFRPIDNFWKISMEGDGTKSLSYESMDLAGQIFSFWRGKTSSSNQKPP